MSFEVGKAYERQTDGITAVIARTDVTGETALLRLKTGDEEWITSADVPARWRLFEICPDCHGTGQTATVEWDKGDFSRRGILPTCPTCVGSGRLHPRPGPT
jgi:DnaJ-class molecular chaperone